MGTKVTPPPQYLVITNTINEINSLIIFLNDESSQHYPVLQGAHKFSPVLCDKHMNQ
jgi:hypothetical protein